MAEAGCPKRGGGKTFIINYLRLNKTIHQTQRSFERNLQITNHDTQKLCFGRGVLCRVLFLASVAVDTYADALKANSKIGKIKLVDLWSEIEIQALQRKPINWNAQNQAGKFFVINLTNIKKKVKTSCSTHLCKKQPCVF